MKNKKGNVAVIAIIILIIAITAGVLGFLLARKTEAPTQNATSSNVVPIAPANFEQLNEDQDYFLIPELGIKFKLDSLLKNDLMYVMEKDSEQLSKTLVASLTSKSLIKEGGVGCSTSGLGSISKVYADYTKDKEYVDPDEDAPWWMTKDGLEKAGAVQFDGFYVLFQNPQDVCTDKNTPALENILSTQMKEVSQSIKNAELID